MLSPNAFSRAVERCKYPGRVNITTGAWVGAFLTESWCAFHRVQRKAHPMNYRAKKMTDRDEKIGMPVEIVTCKIRNDGFQRGLIVHRYKFGLVLR